jgi:hypothetical protein
MNDDAAPDGEKQFRPPAKGDAREIEAGKVISARYRRPRLQAENQYDIFQGDRMVGDERLELPTSSV